MTALALPLVEKAAIYLRISKDATGEHAAWNRQEPLCREIAAQRGWEVVAVYRDTGSASKRKVVRPDYERMRADWAAGLFEKVVVYDLDRFTRQGTELEEWIFEATDNDRLLDIASSNGDYELSHDNGQFFARMKAAVAAQEMASKARRQRDANKNRAHQGRPPSGTRLYGFENNGKTTRPQEVAQVKKMFDLFSAGLTLRSIARELDRDGIATRSGAPWSPSTIRGILSNPRYAGRTRYRGEVVHSESEHWTAVIDGDIFDAVQSVLADPTRLKHTGTAKRHLGAGLYLCGGVNDDGSECRRPMTQTGTVYFCKGHVSRTREYVDAAVEYVIRERLARSDIAEALADTPDVAPMLAEVHDEIARIVARKRTWEDDLYEERIPLDVFRRFSDRADKELADLRARQAALVAPSAAHILLGSDPVARWDESSVETKQAIVRLLCDVVVLKTGRKGPKQRLGFDPNSVRFEWRGQ